MGAAKPIRMPSSRPPQGRRDAAWMERAACGTADPEVFFEKTAGPDSPKRYRDARRICNGCPVQTECADWATATDQDGIWGGIPPATRRARDADTEGGP